MGDDQEPETPRVKTALAQTVRVVNIKKPSTSPSPQRPYVDEKLPPSTASSSRSSFTFRVPRPPRSALPIPRIRQSIITFSFGSKAPSLNSSDRPPERLIFGLRRKHFYAYLGACIILFLISIIIGLVVISAPSKPLVPTFSGLAVSTLLLPNSTQQTAALFFQDQSTKALNLRISPNVETLPFSAPQQLSLVPMQNVSLSSTSFATTSGMFHQLFYVIDQSIMLMNISCTAISPPRCNIISNNIISANLVPTMAPDSGIAAVYLNTTNTWKVFYHNDAYAISFATYENGNWSTTGVVMAAKGVRGSSIAATVFGSSIEVFYVDQKTRMLWVVESINGIWVPPNMVTSIQPPAFSTTSPLAISYSARTDALLAYYTGTDSNIYVFIGLQASIATFPLAISSNLTGRSTAGWRNTPISVMRGAGGVVSVGFNDQIVNFASADDQIQMSILNTTNGVFVPGVMI